MHALVEWTDEEKVSVISLTRVKEPRKDFGLYNLGEVVKASCHGFPGVHSAKILSIRESTIEGKKQLEKLAEDYVEEKNQSAAKKNDKGLPSHDQNNNSTVTTAVSKEKNKQKKGRKSTTCKEDGPKKTKHQENKENKAEKEKKREENKKKKEVGLQKNAEFLQSLDIFKQQTASSQQPQLQVTAPNYQETHLPGQQNGMLQNNNPYQPMQQMTHPYNYWQSTPQHNHMHYSHQDYQQQSLPSNEGYPSHQVSRWQNLPNQTFHPLRPNYMNSAYYASEDPKEQNSTASSFSQIPVMAEEIEKGDEILDSFLARKEVQELSDDTDEMETTTTEDEIEKCKSALKEKEQELNAVQKKLAEMEKELETLRSTSCTCATSQPGEWKTQKNGLPRAGVIPKDLAEKSGMMELMPNSGVFVYPKDIRVSGKKESGTAMARYLMSVFYTNEELVLRGNLMGTNGKDGLNRQIVNTIIAFAVIKGKDTESAIKYSMRTKISALISHERKKTNVDN